jgi:FkbM family methyltransferase
MVSPTIKKTLSRLGLRSALLSVGAKWYPADKPHVVQTVVRDVTVLALANEDVGRRLVFLRQYEPDDADYLASLIRPDDICFDIGGNTGLYTMLMANRARNGEVHSFEPVPLNRHLLAAGVHLNGFTNVVVNECAVGDQNGEMGFSEASDGAYSSLVPVGRKQERTTLKVSVRTLDSYVSEENVPHVDVMKVDVEGAEPLVLKGGSALFASKATQPRVVMLELLDINLSTYGVTVQDIVAQMEAYGYTAKAAATPEGPRAFRASDTNAVVNIFFISSTRT